jgi:hypothetical protein
MTFEDECENKISNLKMQVMNANNIDEVKEQYKELKLIVIEKQKRYWDLTKDGFNTFDEAHYYDLLSRCVDFDDDEYLVTAEELSNVLKLDDKLKEYCKEHIEKDGIVAALKYKQPIARKELIKYALKLANN